MKHGIVGILPIPEIFMVLSGHHGREYLQTDANDFGANVYQMGPNYQINNINSRQFWIRDMTFSPDDSEIHVRTHDPYNDAWETDSNSDFILAFDYADYSTVLSGDVNEDGFVGGADGMQILTNWGMTGASRSDGDVDGDGTVEGDDLAEILSYWAQSVPLPGDVDGDGWVGDTDLSIVIDNWGQSGLGDLNENGVVDGPDYAEVLSYWNPPLEPPSEAIPEPGTLGLMIVISGLALLSRRK